MPEALISAGADQYPVRRTRPAFCTTLPAAPFRADGVPKVGNGGGSEGIGDHMARVLERAARVSYAFVVMNYAAVAGLISFLRRDSIWRP